MSKSKEVHVKNLNQPDEQVAMYFVTTKISNDETYQTGYLTMYPNILEKLARNKKHGPWVITRYWFIGEHPEFVAAGEGMALKEGSFPKLSPEVQ